jgi:hypothetical protein
MRVRMVLVAAAALALCLTLPGTSAAVTPAASPDVSRVQVKIGPVGTIGAGGETVTFRAVARCPAGLEVLEAFVVVRDVFVYFPLTCTGHWQRFVLIAEVLPDEPLFQPGRVQASALVLLVSGAQAQDSRRMRLVLL